MFKMKVTYTPFFEDEEKSETIYFHLRPETMAKIRKSPLFNKIEKLSKLNPEKLDPEEVLDVMAKLAAVAYGKRDGNKFVQSEEISESFVNSAAYDAVIIAFVENPDLFVNFAKQVTGKRM